MVVSSYIVVSKSINLPSKVKNLLYIIILLGHNHDATETTPNNAGLGNNMNMDFQNYYDDNDQSVNRNVNISCFDDLAANANNLSTNQMKSENTRNYNTAPKPTSNPPNFGTLAGLQQKIKQIKGRNVRYGSWL